MRPNKLKQFAGAIPAIALCTMMHFSASALNTCPVPNLWVNGDFENATVGNQCNMFNSVNAYSSAAPYYGYTTFIWEAGMSLQPTYVDEASEDHTYFPSSGGHYLYCDPRANTGVTMQVQQSIKVKGSTTYTFSAWFCSMLMPAYSCCPAVVQLWVNGVAVSSTLTLNSLSPNGWIQLTGTYFAPSDGYVNVSITDDNPVVGGHDFAIDDITFSQGSINVDAGPAVVTCPNVPFSLGGSPTADFGATCGGSYTYLWTPVATLSSNIVSNPTGVIGTPGVYVYTVQVTDVNGNTCSDNVTVTVQDCNKPPQPCPVYNLWVNGDFENAAVGNQCNQFNSVNAYSSASPFYGYTTFIWEAGMSLQPGYVDEASEDHTFYPASGGHYLYCDPRANSGTTMQVQQSIKVQAGNTYTFSAWFCSMLRSAYSCCPAVVQMWVNGVAVTPTLTLNSLSPNGWMNMSGTWLATTTGYVNVYITDESPVVGGHDFAIDDITFGQGVLIADAGPDATLCVGDPYTLGGSPTADFGATCGGDYTYSWSPTVGFTSPSNVANPSIALSAPGVYTYTVTVTDLNGDVCSDDVTITVNQCKDGGRSSAPVTTNNKITVYPNPTDGSVTFAGLPSTASNITICGVNGQTLLNNYVTGSSVTMNISELPAGMYFYIIKDGTGKVIERNKIVKQ